MTKRCLGLTILGWFEIVAGLVGGGFFFFLLIYFLAYIKSYDGRGIQFLWAFAAFLPSALMFLTLSFLGAGVLRLRKWAWRLNVFLYPLMHIYIYIPGLWLPKQWRVYLVAYIFEKISIVWWLILAILIAYLLLPGVKAQFFRDACDNKFGNDD